MIRPIKTLSYLLICLAVVAGSCFAKTSHVSINQRLFDLGKIPLLKVNIVSTVTDTDRFQFILQQEKSSERLMVDRVNNFLYLLQGIEEVNDPKATLLIKEYMDGYWIDVASLELFAADVPVGNPPPSKKLSMYRQTEQGAAMTSPLQASKAIVAAKPKAPMAEKPSVNAAVRENCQIAYDGKQTLWRLANHYAKEWNTNVYAAALGIFEANPNAFYHNNPSSLRGDAKLQCPSAELLSQYRDKSSAEKKFDGLL